jgi:hypothetical protein
MHFDCRWGQLPNCTASHTGRCNSTTNRQDAVNLPISSVRMSVTCLADNNVVCDSTTVTVATLTHRWMAGNDYKCSMFLSRRGV